MILNFTDTQWRVTGTEKSTAVPYRTDLIFFTPRVLCS